MRVITDYFVMEKRYCDSDHPLRAVKSISPTYIRTVDYDIYDVDNYLLCSYTDEAYALMSISEQIAQQHPDTHSFADYRIYCRVSFDYGNGQMIMVVYDTMIETYRDLQDYNNWLDSER